MIKNNLSSSINLQEIDFTWDSSGGTHLKTIYLGTATTIWSGNAQSPQAITSFTTTPTIAAGSSANLILDFSPKTAPTGTTLTVYTNQSCQVTVTN